MSRWTDEFDKASLNSLWDDLKLEASRIVLPDEANPEDFGEVNRLRKAINYIAEVFAHIDPELMPLDLAMRIKDQIGNCHGHVKEYVELSPDSTMATLNNANQTIDSILTDIVPYAIANQSNTKAVANAFFSDIKAKTEQVKNLLNKTHSVAEKTFEMRENLEKVNANVGAMEDAARLFGEKTLNAFGGKNSLEHGLEVFRAKAQQQHDEIGTYHKQLKAGDDSISSKINNAREEIFAKLGEVKEKVDALRDFHEKVFGKEQEDGNTEGGLRQEIEKRQSALETYRTSMEQTHARLKKDIEASLPGATAAGLAEAYRELKESSRTATITYTVIFCFALVGIFVLGSYFVLSSGDSAIDGNITIAAWFREDILKKALLFGAPIWLAFFSAKRRSEARRLQEEYAHKESFVKFYVGFKKHIEALEEGKEGKEETLMKQLIEAAIKAISLNASATLDKKHGENTPIQEIVEEAMKNVINKAKSSGKS